MNRFSICIPTWEQHGVGLKHLQELKASIDKQTFTDYEIIVSDHSQTNDIRDFCSNNGIRYFRYRRDLGNSSSNLNNAIRWADGEIIKVMFQDDLMYSENGLKILDRVFREENTEWVVTGCNHTNDGKLFYRDFIPSWNDNIQYGVNTISSPSVLAFKNGNGLFFDENLTMLMDVEYYYQLYKKFGYPLIISNILVSNRIHEHQISSLYDSKNLDKEIQYIKNKYEY